MTVLIIENDRELARSLKQSLQNKNITCFHCDNGADGLDAALCMDYSIILISLNLRLVDGLEVIKRIRLKPLAVPIVAMGLNRLYEKEIALKQGADSFLQKPFYDHELIEHLGNFNIPLASGVSK